MAPTVEKKEYRYVGDHAIELEVGDTRPQLGFGDFIELSADDVKLDYPKELISSGLLVDTNKIHTTQTEQNAIAKAEEAAASDSSDTDSKGGK